METREIEAFLTLAEELHYGRAAERLHRTTSYVSQTIKLLERRVGGRLFERTSRRVSLTPLGEQFQADLAPGYHAIQNALRRARAALYEESPVLRVAATTTVSPELVNQVAEAFLEKAPNVELVLQTMPYSQYFTWYDKDGPISTETDALLSWVPAVTPKALPAERLRVGPVIATSDRVLLMHQSHPLAGRSTVDVEELADHRLLFPVVGNREFGDAWCPEFTPAGRRITRVDVNFIFPEELPTVLREGLLHATGAGIYRRALNFPGLLTVPVTGMEPLLLVTSWPVALDSELIQRFAEAAARSGR